MSSPHNTKGAEEMDDAEWLRWFAKDLGVVTKVGEKERLNAIADRLERPEAVTEEMEEAGTEAAESLGWEDVPAEDVIAIYEAMHRVSKVSPPKSDQPEQPS